MLMRGRIFLIGICILLIGIMISLQNSTKKIDNSIQLNVINAKYNDGFIIIELEDSEEYKTVEEYSINKIKIINIKEKSPNLKKYFNRYGHLLKVELFYNDSLI